MLAQKERVCFKIFKRRHRKRAVCRSKGVLRKSFCTAGRIQFSASLFIKKIPAEILNELKNSAEIRRILVQ